MAANPLPKRGPDARPYQFIVGVTLATLEDDVNRTVHEDPDLRLLQVFYATGIGFVGVLERHREPHVPAVRAPSPVTAHDRGETVSNAEKARKKR